MLCLIGQDIANLVASLVLFIAGQQTGTRLVHSGLETTLSDRRAAVAPLLIARVTASAGRLATSFCLPFVSLEDDEWLDDAITLLIHDLERSFHLIKWEGMRGHECGIDPFPL